VEQAQQTLPPITIAEPVQKRRPGKHLTPHYLPPNFLNNELRDWSPNLKKEKSSIIKYQNTLI
jgi:hypothetical protein